MISRKIVHLKALSFHFATFQSCKKLKLHPISEPQKWSKLQFFIFSINFTFEFSIFFFFFCNCQYRNRISFWRKGTFLVVPTSNLRFEDQLVCIRPFLRALSAGYWYLIVMVFLSYFIEFIAMNRAEFIVYCDKSKTR